MGSLLLLNIVTCPTLKLIATSLPLLVNIAQPVDTYLLKVPPNCEWCRQAWEDVCELPLVIGYRLLLECSLLWHSQQTVKSTNSTQFPIKKVNYRLELQCLMAVSLKINSPVLSYPKSPVSSIMFFGIKCKCSMMNRNPPQFNSACQRFKHKTSNMIKAYYHYTTLLGSL